MEFNNASLYLKLYLLHKLSYDEQVWFDKENVEIKIKYFSCDF